MIGSRRLRLAIPAFLFLLAVVLPAAAEPRRPVPRDLSIFRFDEFRSIDGTGNNVAHPDRGAASTPLLRHMAQPDYEDQVESPPSSGLPGPREVSNAVVAAPGRLDNARGASNFLWQWGQFIDHDFSKTFPGVPAEPMPIAVPMGDPWFDPLATGTQEIGFSRAVHSMVSGVRQQVNEITAFIDGSQVYGSDPARAAALRRHDGSGFLATSQGGFLPYNEAGLPNEPTAGDASFFLAGDVRANEQLGLTAMHTLFVREHNHQVRRLRRLHARWTADELYETARAIVGAEIQVITYKEFLPLLLGPDALPPYAGYQPDVDPGIDNAFSAAAFRLGHTLLTPELLRLKHNGQPIPRGHVTLREAFFVPDELRAGQGIEPILRGLALHRAQEIDPYIVDDVRNFLFGPPGAGGFDLASLNIQRGRDHGLPRYNAMRVQMGLAAKVDFADVSSDPEVQSRLAAVYDDVDAIDLWVGCLSEDHAPGAMVGELLKTILCDQFTRLRDGDRFWYENHFSDAMVRELEMTTLARIIRRNTSIGGEIPDNVFEIEIPVAARRERRGPSDASLAGTPSASPGALATVFPNPARTHVMVTLGATGSHVEDESAPARVSIYDVRGRLVRTLPRTHGTSTWRWDLDAANGTRVIRGLYFVRVETGEERSTHKVFLLD